MITAIAATTAMKLTLRTKFGKPLNPLVATNFVAKPSNRGPGDMTFVTACGPMMSQELAKLHPDSKPRRGRSIWLVWVVAGIVVVAVLLLIVAGRRSQPGAPKPVDAIGPEGLSVSDSVSSWESVFEVVVITRRAVRGNWFGFEILSETGGALVVDGKTDLGRQFLAETYRFHGFDHHALKATLESSNGRAVCYKR